MSDLKSSSADVQVDSFTGDYIVPLPAPAGFPIRHISFESGVIGEKANTIGDGLDYLLGSESVYYSNQNVNTGGRSANFDMPLGEGEGVGDSGGGFNLSKNIVGEIWLKCSLYIPTGFSFISGSTQGQKFLRPMGQIDGVKTGTQAFDLYIDDNGLLIFLTGVGDAKTEWYETPCAIVPEGGTRYCYQLGNLNMPGRNNIEGYVKFRTDNTGIVRCWLNGELVFEATGVKTTIAGWEGVYGCHVFSGAQPSNYTIEQDGGVYLDDIVVASENGTPPNIDASGNRYIGSWPGV